MEIAAVFNNATNGPMVGAFVGSVYPESYPASLPAYELAFSVTYRDVIDAAVPYEFRSALDDIGLESTRWP